MDMIIVGNFIRMFLMVEHFCDYFWIFRCLKWALTHRHSCSGTYPYNRYMGPWVLMSDWIYVMMEADILSIDTIVSHNFEEFSWNLFISIALQMLRYVGCKWLVTNELFLQDGASQELKYTHWMMLVSANRWNIYPFCILKSNSSLSPFQRSSD